MLNYNYLLF